MKRRTIITSVLVIVLCLGLISGSTFALFTSEDSVNIAITSGKVSVVATIDPTSLKVYSASTESVNSDGEAGTLDGTFAGTYYYKAMPVVNNTTGTFANGGTATLTNTKTLEIDRITPGDKVKVTVNVENQSNVITKYRVRVNVLDGETLEDQAKSLKLFEGLTVKVGTEELKGVIRVSNWTTLPAREPNSDDNLTDIPVEIFLPLKAGNEYQDLKTEIQITVEAVQSNAATNTELELINAYLAQQEPTTMNAAIKSLVGAQITGLTTLADYAAAFAKVQDYLWNVDTNQFYAESDATDFAYKYFKVYKSMPTDQTYSIYAYDDGTTSWTNQNVNVVVGFDAGETTGITSVTYNRSTAEYGQDVVIRTNSFTTNIEINAPKDVIKHYDNVGTLNIIAAANASYHEYGKVAYAYISKGRMTIEEGSKVTNLHINSIKEDNVTTNEFDSITISIAENANKPTFSRDDVEIAQNGTLVVAIQNGTEELTEETPLDYVWLTKQGIFEQIKVSESDTEITSNAQWADKLGSEKEKTQEAAFEIANNIGRNAITQKVEQGVTVGTTEYTVTLNEETRELVVENTTTSGVVTPEEKAVVVEEAITKPSVVDNIDEIIEEAINADAVANGYVVRIDETYYETFEAAYAEVKTGDTIHILQDCYASYHGQYAYDFTGKNVNIYVEKDATLMCGDVTNGKFVVGWVNSAGKLTLEGPGKITFDSNNTWGLITQNGSGNNITAVVRNVTIEASSANSFIMNGNITIESGYFKNLTFGNSNKVLGGYFTTDVTSLLPEGKMVTASDVAGYTYKVTALDAAHASFVVEHNNELSYFSTLNGASAAAVSGDTVTFIGANSIVMVDGGQNKFSVNDGVTYDLNNHTIQAVPGAKAFYMGFGSKTITMKNGTINATSQLCEDNSIYTFVVVAENLRINDTIRDSALSHIGNGVFVYDESDFFTIKDSIPTDYKAKLVHNNISYYFTYNGSVADAIGMVNNGDTVNIYESLSTLVNTSLIIGNSFTVIKDTNVSFPDESNLKSQTGHIVIGTPNENTVTYNVEQSYVCRIGDTGYLTFADAWSALSNNQTIVLLEDITLDSTVSTTVKKTAGKIYTLDFNGHTITCNGNAKIYIQLNTDNTSSKFYFKDTVGGGGIKRSDSTATYVVIQQAKQGSIFIQSGKYELLGGNPFNFNASQTWTIEGGIINCLPFYEDTIKNYVKVGCTITLNGVEYTRTDS